MSKYAPANAEGLYPYVITKRSPLIRAPWSRIEYASSLAAAKFRFGWTREQHTTVTVRRATPDDLSTSDAATADA